MIAIIDYGMGNIASVSKACAYFGYSAKVTSNKKEIADASHIILPGVGAARDAVAHLKQRELFDFVIAQARTGKPFLGICLGMQLLLNKSYEDGEHECLGLVPGEVIPFKKSSLRIPHMGWNDIKIKKNPIITQDNAYVYFVHSYHASGVPEENVIATCDYAETFTAAVRNENIFGTQFHPEKSGDVGLNMIKNFGGLKL